MSEARQLPLPFVHEPSYREEDFLPAPANEEALAWLQRCDAWPFRRLALWGETGVGKTHLLHIWSARGGATLLRGPSLRDFATGAISTAVAVDEADAAEDEPLLHVINALAESGYPLLLAARDPPSRWPARLPDLVSRLRATTAVRIRPADDALLASLLARLLADRQLGLSAAQQAHLLRHLPRSQGALQAAVARLDRLCLDLGSLARARDQVIAELSRGE
jgi:chromosomal replication initiation ATPase DnaA